MPGQHHTSSSAAVAGDFSAPNVNSIYGVQIKRIPAGEAFGARDLTRWASHRRAGRSSARASVEKTNTGWMALLPDGAVGGPFATKDAAWQWILAHRSRAEFAR
jgi:hypothetical protein